MKKRVWVAFVVVLVLLAFATIVYADKPTGFDQKGNETSWENGNAFDEWGYNYNGHMFSGRYCDFRRGEPGWWDEFCDVDLIMKWNDTWLSNQDRDNDGELDRHWGYDSYIGSGAWETNHMRGEYELDGRACKWTYFVKIVAVPEDASLQNDIWYAADGTEIGPLEWGAFAVIQKVYNDPCGGFHGIEYLSPHHAGFGGW